MMGISQMYPDVIRCIQVQQQGGKEMQLQYNRCVKRNGEEKREVGPMATYM